MLVGTIMGVTMVNILTQRAYIYPEARIVAQTLTVIYMRCMVTREDVFHLPHLQRPYLTVMAICYYSLNCYLVPTVPQVSQLAPMLQFCPKARKVLCMRWKPFALAPHVLFIALPVIILLAKQIF